MGDGSLSQDEIDALLQGADDIVSGPEPSMGFDAPPSRGASSFSPMESNNIRNILNSSISAVAPALSGYLGGRNLVFSNPVVEAKPQETMRNDFRGRFVQVAVNFTGAISGRNLVVFNYRDAGIISSLMMGDDSGTPPAEITDAHQSTIQEFTNQLISSLATQFSGKVGGGIGTSPAVVSVANTPAELQLPPGEVIKITYDMTIDGILNSKLYHIIDAGIAGVLGTLGAPQVSPQPQYQYTPPQAQISSVRFPQMGESISSGGYGDISLLLDVEMTLTVELGRTTKLVKDILGLGEGSIIELDKLAGEPVDLLVNGKLIAKGEVVVIDENFGVRVTDIVSQDERFKSINR
ncbi:MAG TPA: flagellar motor switch protein FliN [Spirochaetota bacterium]|jgi:flagellar motor switch protein FliN/FliY|nr:flagellar motor switch protein FliN [Spirochaetota bacterium]OQA98912.1 MAG: Flagellar motor switch protein FliN [Spirochaetes bacterium ADurb.Bin218]HON15430.1 flagellar motor switch protein FliN [Spirochaetota bacterium]HOQ11651.1 flagellar motor switch protein FliN [Spirochaetota bacterium]HOV08588.1 flagellar motor switch protein FliN [Spirochaetota bacterium]